MTNLIGIWCGSLRIKSNPDTDTRTTLDVRRVKPEDGDEHVQISITVEKAGPKRTTYGHGYLKLDNYEIDALIRALTKVHPHHETVKKKIASAGIDENRFWAAFYDIIARYTKSIYFY